MNNRSDWPELTFPKDEAVLLLSTYGSASVILEYGSGGSTWKAAQMPGKRIFSVESDLRWALNLEVKIESEAPPSPATIHYVDIGNTGRWGRPLDDRKWPNFYSYPTSIWHQTFFRHPDVVLIDGRLRPACLIACCLFAKHNITVLFDDYTSRPRYSVVENIIKPERIVGRMARFEIAPRNWTSREISLLAELSTHMTYANGFGEEHSSFYSTPYSRVLGVGL